MPFVEREFEPGRPVEEHSLKGRPCTCKHRYSRSGEIEDRRAFSMAGPMTMTWIPTVSLGFWNVNRTESNGPVRGRKRIAV